MPVPVVAPKRSRFGCSSLIATVLVVMFTVAWWGIYQDGQRRSDPPDYAGMALQPVPDGDLRLPRAADEGWAVYEYGDPVQHVALRFVRVDRAPECSDDAALCVVVEAMLPVALSVEKCDLTLKYALSREVTKRLPHVEGPTLVPDVTTTFDIPLNPLHVEWVSDVLANNDLAQGLRDVSCYD